LPGLPVALLRAVQQDVCGDRGAAAARPAPRPLLRLGHARARAAGRPRLVPLRPAPPPRGGESLANDPLPPARLPHHDGPGDPERHALHARVPDRAVELPREHSGHEAAMKTDQGPASFDGYAQNYDAALNQGLAVSGEDKGFFARGRIAWLARCLDLLQFRPA